MIKYHIYISNFMRSYYL